MARPRDPKPSPRPAPGPPRHAGDRSLARPAGYLAAALELLLVLGLLRRRRAAWAFALSLEGTQLLVNLLGMPQILHGASQLVSVLVVLARSTLFGFLVVASNEYRDIDDV